MCCMITKGGGGQGSWNSEGGNREAGNREGENEKKGREGIG